MKLFTYLKNIVPFLKDVRAELKRVDWPSKKDTIKYTLVVIGASLTVAFFLGGLDFLFTFLINKFVI
jgi:preprotein translocase subunit SecE